MPDRRRIERRVALICGRRHMAPVLSEGEGKLCQTVRGDEGARRQSSTGLVQWRRRRRAALVGEEAELRGREGGMEGGRDGRRER